MSTPADPADPRTNHPHGTFPVQEQEQPGSTEQTEPTPDHGEKTYVGAGRLTDRRALITGGDSGIGRAVAIAFAREGADVVITHMPEEKEDAASTVDLIEQADRRGFALGGDVRDEGFATGIVSDTIDRLGGIDILVLNAAYQRNRSSFAEIPTAEFDIRLSRQ